MKTHLLIKLHPLGLLLTLFLLLTCGLVKAEGSKETNPTSAARATLQIGTTPDFYWPYINSGRHFVYAKVGERITLAAQSGITFRLTSPSGIVTTYVSTTSAGTITSAAQETAGPKISATDTTPNTYTPIYHDVNTKSVLGRL